MANHKSAEKRARQAPKREARNRVKKSQVHTADRALRKAINQLKASPKDKTTSDLVGTSLKNAFSVVQKARGALHRNTIKRKMARLAKAASVALKSAAS